MRQPPVGVGLLLLAIGVALLGATFSTALVARAQPRTPSAAESTAIPRENPSLRAQLNTAQERIEGLEAALGFERKVNDELMRQLSGESGGAQTGVRAATVELDRVLKVLEQRLGARAQGQ